MISAQRSTSFNYDTVLDGASQERTFEEVGRPLCETVMQGVNATVRCYGQTGGGKSFTVVGNGQDYHTRGILPRALGQLLSATKSSNREVCNSCRACLACG